jgi:hypothetical protein
LIFSFLFLSACPACLFEAAPVLSLLLWPPRLVLGHCLAGHETTCRPNLQPVNRSRAASQAVPARHGNARTARLQQYDPIMSNCCNRAAVAKDGQPQCKQTGLLHPPPAHPNLTKKNISGSHSENYEVCLNNLRDLWSLNLIAFGGI